MLLGEYDRNFSGEQKSHAQRVGELTNELKDAQREFNNLNIGTPEYFEAIKVMNEITTPNTQLDRHQDLGENEGFVSGKNEDTEKALDEYKMSTFFENTCNRNTKDALDQYRTYRQVYMSRYFIGPHAIKLMMNSEEIINTITENLKNNFHREVEQYEIDSKCKSVKNIL